MTKKDYIEKILKGIDKISGKYKSSEIFLDMVDYLTYKGHLKYGLFKNEMAETNKRIEKRYSTSQIGEFYKIADLLIEAIKNTVNDILGETYMNIGKNEKLGQFFTPNEFSELASRLGISDKTDIIELYEPCSGSGGNIIAQYRFLKSKGINIDNIKARLTDYDEKCAKMAYIQMEALGMEAIIYNTDTLENNIGSVDEEPCLKFFTSKYINKRITSNPVCDDEFDLYKYKEEFEGVSIQVTNPPYSVKWSADKKFLEDERFKKYGVLAPSSKADFAFIQHVEYHMAKNGRAAIILPHGILFRGSAEEKIRKYLIEKLNVIDAIVGLPANCFIGTSIPVCCIILEKNRTNKNICFIDASNYYTQDKKMNYITEEDIERIVDAYKNRKEVERFCHIAELSEVKENDYNLNIPRYVDTFEPEPEVDIDQVLKDIHKIDNEIASATEEVNKYLKELGLNLL